MLANWLVGDNFPKIGLVASRSSAVADIVDVRPKFLPVNLTSQLIKTHLKLLLLVGTDNSPTFIELQYEVYVCCINPMTLNI